VSYSRSNTIVRAIICINGCVLAIDPSRVFMQLVSWYGLVRTEPAAAHSLH